jgi:hypothetical protein
MVRDQRGEQGEYFAGRGTGLRSFPSEKETRLLELQNKELELLQQIRELTERQTELLLADDIEAFGESIDSRQELIEKINGLHQESNILMQYYISFAGAAGAGKIDAIEDMNRQLAEELAGCVELNDKNATLTKEKTADYMKQIGKLSLGRKSLGAYVQDVPNDSQLFDKKT